ncbi:hypothetical protein DH2020_003799 [Rehmannia glutinosa]|uniref:SBP-type domain-containing protein n=1 Tax=Rehmannia glutinosa TaxID=99300 RepID=A0ABR0XMR4_REHGL
MESSSFLGSSKRAKAPGNQVVHCLVDGCNADLSLCRDYHRRHKVCEVHSKTAKVSIGGREQRFCQQCSRFHSLVEFDEGKRSCRKRLDGHNRRRRKPQPIDRNSGLDFPNQQVTPVVDSDRALSLLSSATQVTRELGLNRLVQSEPLHIHHSINYGGLGQLNELGQESKPVISSADLHGSNTSILHSPEMFQHGPEGSSTSGPHQTLTFMWE